MKLHLGTLHAWPGNLPLARVHLDRPARAPTGGSCSLLCFRARRALQHRRTQQVAASAPIPWALPESNGVGSTGTLTGRVFLACHAAWIELGYWEATKAQGPQQQNQGWRRLDGGRGGKEAAVPPDSPRPESRPALIEFARPSSPSAKGGASSPHIGVGLNDHSRPNT